MKTSSTRGSLAQCRSRWLLGAVVGLLSVCHPAEGARVLLVGGTFTPGETDQTFVDFLQGKGHTLVAPIARYVEVVPPAALIDQADIVIVARSTASGDYDSAGIAAQWNSINKPLLLMNPFLTRGNARWGWASTNTLNENKPAPTDFDPFPDPSHPFVDGLTTSVFPSTFNDGTTAMSIDWVGTASQAPAGSTVVATMTVDSVNNVLGILDIPAGTTLFADNSGNATVTSQRRVFFQMNEYPDRDDVFILSGNGGLILDRIINTIAVPEPSGLSLGFFAAVAAAPRRRRHAVKE